MTTLGDLLPALLAIGLFLLVAAVLGGLWRRYLRQRQWQEGDPSLEGAEGGGGDARTFMQTLSFNELIRRYRSQETDDEVTSSGEPEVREQPIDEVTDQFDHPSRSPISGRIMRDGRFRRNHGDTPGREVDQDFRRPDASNPPPQPPPPPDPNPPE